MSTVGHHEANLLTLAAFITGHRGAIGVHPLLHQPHTGPTGLSPDGIAALQQLLARGVALDLIRAGGWARHQGQRLWDRPLPPLQFTVASTHILRWILQHAPGTPVAPLQPRPCTPADAWFVSMAIRALARAGLRHLPWPAHLVAHPLVWLRVGHHLQAPPPALTFTPGLFPWLAAAQPELARTWLAVEEEKLASPTAARWRALGALQHGVLHALFATLHTHHRLDLAGFLVPVAQALHPRSASAHVPPHCGEDAPMEVVFATRRHAVALLAALVSLDTHLARWRRVAFFDDHYDRAQQRLEQFAPLAACLPRFRTTLQALTSLSQPSEPPCPAPTASAWPSP